MSDLREEFISTAQDLGFDRVGFTGVAPLSQAAYYRRWIAEEKHGTMAWMASRTEQRTDPSRLHPGAQTIIALSFNYFQDPPPARARIARYALGSDYHNLIYKRLKKLCTLLRSHGGEQKPYVDTGPILEKPLAALAGLGWQGKHTVLIDRKAGSYFFIGIILTTLRFDPDPPEPERCGKCQKCIDICPTKAITAPFQLDARRCIAYLTIEHQGPIPMEFRTAIGDHLFGCDDCMEVCPWNHWARQTREAKFEPRKIPDLAETLSWDQETFQSFFQGSPVRRLGLERWLRNVCVVLGNIGTQSDLPALEAVLCGSGPLVAEHASWALDQIRARMIPRIDRA
ncbi:MAG: tRNA epoxyqueuosine(34) reductase QueG [Puniceicoccaceae bacterium]